MARSRAKHGGAALVGGGLLLWLLLRGGGGGGLGTGRRGFLARLGGPPRPARVRIGPEGITVDGEPTDVEGAVAGARSAGSAILVVSGAARAGNVAELARALLDANIPVASGEDLHRLAEVG